MIYRNILREDQLKLLPNLKYLPKQSYMAGGTALALQLGHRTSLDFDFYSPGHFETEKFMADFQKEFKEVKVQRTAKDTLILEVNGVSFSLFYYPYQLISTPIDFENVKLAAVEDIAAMKMVAISMRGRRRDFIDVYYLLKYFSLEEMINMTLKKYPSYQPMVILKGLIYFRDAEVDDISRKIEIFDKNFSWDKAKKKLFEEVKKYQLSMLKKD